MNAVAARANSPANRIEFAEQIPAYIDNLCRPGGPVRMREEDSRLVALLDIGEKRVRALWAGSTEQRDILMSAVSRAKALGYQILDTREAASEIILLCREGRQQEEEEEEIEDTEATRLFDRYLVQALELNASDLHLQVLRRHARMMARVNGELVELGQMSIKSAETLARAMYSQADVDSRMGKPNFNARTYQDASLSRNVTRGDNVTELKLRWASGPVWPDAFDVSLRILNITAGAGTRTLESLGYRPIQIRALTHALKQPSGLILLCGTTGAGKSTTLATLAEMWGRRYEGMRMMRTIEDPPEYVIALARQMPVSRQDKGGEQEEGFHAALRAAMRMDPDALLLGEIRDAATADLGQQAVDTGHKVLSTVHSGSVFEALWRLIRLGIDRDRLASEGFINAIVHQTLVPTLCPHCSLPYSRDRVGEEVHEELAAQLDEKLILGSKLRGEGCEHCHGAGLGGRVALSSILMPDTTMRLMIREGREVEARQYWRAGKCKLHGEAQALSIVDQALDLIGKGVLSAVDADKHIGGFSEEFEVERAEAAA